MTFARSATLLMDLKAHVEMDRSEVRIRPAGPNENDASVLHLQFTAITKPMIDEIIRACGKMRAMPCASTRN